MTTTKMNNLVLTAHYHDLPSIPDQQYDNIILYVS